MIPRSTSSGLWRILFSRERPGISRVRHQSVGSMTKRLLFTGAGGFIGRQAAPYLLERGYEVHAVDIRPIVLKGMMYTQLI